LSLNNVPNQRIIFESKIQKYFNEWIENLKINKIV
jgi:hypothetical protein